jgi:hypothetical protein
MLPAFLLRLNLPVAESDIQQRMVRVVCPLATAFVKRLGFGGIEDLKLSKSV